MVHLAHPTLPRFLALAAGISFLSSGVAVAQGWVPIGPTGVGVVTSLSAGHTAVYAGTCNGVYRSSDGGSIWREAGLQGECVNEIEADPRSDVIYAILRSRVWIPYFPEPSHLTVESSLFSTLSVSHDGGRSWKRTPLLDVTAVAVDPTAPDTAYAAALFSPLWVTRDSGRSWNPLPQFPAGGVRHLSIDPRNGAIYGGAADAILVVANGDWSSIPFDFFVDVAEAGFGPDGAVYAVGRENFCRSTTAAPEWSCNFFPGSLQASILEIPGSQSEAPRILVAGYDGIWSSDDGGTSWSLVVSNVAGYTPALALDNAGSVVYAGNDVGVYRSEDRGNAWTNASGGLRATWVRALSLDPAEPSTIWAGAMGRLVESHDGGPGLFRTTDAGDSWTAVSGAEEQVSVSTIAVDPSNPLVRYAGFPGAVIRTQDGGMSWSRSTLGTGGVFVFGLEVDPNFPRVWAATDSGGLKTKVGGHAWSSSTVTQDIFSLLFDTRRPGTMYAGAAWMDVDYDFPLGLGGSIYTSRNSGGTWTRTAEDLGAAVFALAIDPFSDSAVYAGTFFGGILRSPDAGVTWEKWNAQFADEVVLALVADPVRPGTLYAGTWSGVFRSVDGGRLWLPFSEGLSPRAAMGLAVSDDGTWLYAGTDGSGVFQRKLTVIDRTPVTTVNRPRAPRNVPPRPPP